MTRIILLVEKAAGKFAELRIRKLNGQWSSKGSTYGRDPEKSHG